MKKRVLPSKHPLRGSTRGRERNPKIGRPCGGGRVHHVPHARYLSEQRERSCQSLQCRGMPEAHGMCWNERYAPPSVMKKPLEALRVGAAPNAKIARGIWTREALLLAAVLGLLVPQIVGSAPAHHPGAVGANECLRQENTEALCQRCAKSTKSVMVYPMCCGNQEDVRAWCVRYLDYGLQ